MDVVLDNLDRYWVGFKGTVGLTVASAVVAFVLGVVVAAFRVSPVPPLRWVGAAWVELVRNTPLTVLFFLFFFGFPKLGITLEPFPSSILVLSAYTSTFVAETVRAGFNAVPKGQAEAARALGLTFPGVLAHVVVPQALRTVVGPLGSLLIALTKNSSIAASISALELTTITNELGFATGQWLPLFLGSAAAYLLLTIPSGLAVGVLERKVAIRR